MTVPARNVFDPVTLLDLDSENGVLEDLVQGVSDVERAIRVRWPIMEDKLLIGWPVCGLPLVKGVGASLEVVLLKL